MTDWKTQLLKTFSGVTIPILTETSSDTSTTVRRIAPLIDREVNIANAIIRANPSVRVVELRQDLPTLSTYSADTDLITLIKYKGEFPDRFTTRNFTNGLIGSVTRDYGLSEDTIEWYRTHRSRQIKALKRGRPRKAKLGSGPHK